MIKLATEPEQPDFTLLLSGKKGKTEPQTFTFTFSAFIVKEIRETL